MTVNVHILNTLYVRFLAATVRCVFHIIFFFFSVLWFGILEFLKVIYSGVIYWLSFSLPAPLKDEVKKNHRQKS